MEEMMMNMKIKKDRSIEMSFNVSDLPLYIQQEQLSDFPDMRGKPHWNKGMETIYVKTGKMNICVNGKKTLLNEKDLCLINAGCVHYIESFDGENCVYFCGIAEETLFTARNAIIKKYIDPVFHSFHPDIAVIPADSEDSKPIRELFREIMVLLEHKPLTFDLQIIGLSHMYLAHLCEALQNTDFFYGKKETKMDEAMRKILSYIHENYGRNIQIKELCEAGYVSRNQCFQIFRKYTGDTPAEYILRYRLYAAEEMLLKTQMPISEIAISCGFAHQSHFTNQFTKVYKSTPLQFRKKGKEQG